MQVVIVGAGGHGKVVLDIVRAAGGHTVAGFVDADPSLAGQSVGGVPILGPINFLPKLRQQKVKGAIVAIGDNRTRREYAALLLDYGFELINAIHPAAFVSPSATVGKNVVVAPGASVITEARLGNSCIVNTNAIVDHECNVGEGAHICPGAILAGRVTVGAGAFIGIGAQVIPCLTIGQFATIGGGAVVTRDIPDFATAVGVPARVIKVAGLPPGATHIV